MGFETAEEDVKISDILPTYIFESVKTIYKNLKWKFKRSFVGKFVQNFFFKIL